MDARRTPSDELASHGGDWTPAGARLPQELALHGGNLTAARARFPDAPLPWIDLSTGINPFPYRIGTIAPSAWTRLPEPAGLTALEAAARAAYGVRPEAEIVAAPGTQALLQWLPRIVATAAGVGPIAGINVGESAGFSVGEGVGISAEVRAGTCVQDTAGTSAGVSVGILGPTYAEHEKCWRAAGARVATVAAARQLTGFDVAVVVNPNNPDGRVVPPETLVHLARRNGTLIVDEAFMDVLDERDSLVPYLPLAGAIVLRSFGKMYGLAGLRLGFAIAAPPVGASLRGALGPWAVSGPAIEVGGRALADTGWRAEMRLTLRDAAARLDGLLRSAGFTIEGGTSLFRLAAHPDAARWFERLARAGILTRPFDERPCWLRFGLPGEAAEWDRLAAGLRG